MNKILALTNDGRITFCTASEDQRGKGRCNHVSHQKEGQSTADFIASIENNIIIEDSLMADQKEAILNLISQYGRTENPNWKNTLSSINNPFTIGSKEDGTYEEALLVDFKEQLIEKEQGNVYKLTAFYEFRGNTYECDFGEVPTVNNNGTITMDGINWRVLPVVEQNKAGLISYNDNIVIKQTDGRNLAMTISKNEDIDTVKIYGVNVPIDVVQEYFKNGSTDGLNSGQIFSLNAIDPIVYDRFPGFDKDIRSLKTLPPDEYGDLEMKRCIRYEDVVQDQMRLQMRRMGVTFRQNLSKRQNLEDQRTQEEIDNGITEDRSVLDAKYPLFYQVNLTDNIKSELIGRSNVQQADDLNPIAALSQSQKISYTGPGGYHKDKAPYNLRMPHKSHEFIIDPMDVSAGKNVGLTGTLSMGYIGDDRLIHAKDPNICLAPSDFIPFRNHNDPNRGIMGVAHMKQASPITGGEDPIHLGDPSDKAWDKIKGCKLGTNLRIAYVPGKYKFEDAVELSESAAARMTTIQSQKYEVADVKSLNLKVGQRFEMKDKIGNTTIKYAGNIKSISDKGFEIETVFLMTPGNKIAGRHGNKSIVAAVIPDNEMPKIIENGKEVPVHIVMSPLSVAGRKNLGQVMETNQAAGYGATIDKTHTVVLNDGTKIEATAGIQYIMRLNHIAEKKLSSHADEITSKREAEGSRLGEMESILLSTDKDRLKILEYLRHQDAYDSHNKLNFLLKAVGVKMTGVNWDRDKKIND